MVQRVYFVNDGTKRKYEVLENNVETTGEVVLRGAEAPEVQFTLKFDKAQFKTLGYRLVREEDDGDED